MRLRLRDTVLELERGRPLIMGILNANPDSFSDPPRARSAAALVERGHELVRDGAALVDVGGESGRTDRNAISPREEIDRVVPRVERLTAEGIAVSVDTWRAEPARAALDAGAAMINDVSGLSDPALAEMCAAAGAGLVITHTRAAPKTKAFPDYEDVVADVLAFQDKSNGMGTIITESEDAARAMAEQVGQGPPSDAVSLESVEVREVLAQA